MTDRRPATGASRRRPGPRRPAAGFTLIELLLVLALLVLVGTLFVSGASDWMRAREQTPEDVFWLAVMDARQQALRGDETVVLRFDPKNRQFLWGEGETAHTLAWPGRSVDFLPAQEGATVLLGGMLVETERITSVRFYPDGSCDPFRAQLTEADGRKRTLNLDPWTCAPMLGQAPRT